MAKALSSLLLVMIWMSLSCSVYLALASRAAVIVLQQSLPCASTFVNEGSNATACATIVYTYEGLPLASSVSVMFTTSNGTALSPYDYTAISQVQRFDAGSSEGQSVCVNISTANDTNVEYDETFSVTLSTSYPNVTIGDRGGGITFQVLIIDDDVAIFAFTGDPHYYWWENRTQNTLCPTLVQGNLERPVTVNMYLTSGTAIVSSSLPADVLGYWVYAYYSSGSVIGTKSCGDIYIVDDNHLESNEMFYGTIQPYTEGCGCTLPCRVKSTYSTLLNNMTAYITINDDEVVQISPWEGNPSLVVEEDITLNFCIKINNSIILDVSVNSSFEAISGTATRNKDFIQNQSSIIIFSPGSTKNSYACTSVEVLQDSILEYNEFFILNLFSTNSRVAVTRNGTFQIIEDGDNVTIGFAHKIFNGTEGNNDPFQICALLMIGSLERFVSVFITTLDTGATATVGMDYVPLIKEEVVFSPGASAVNNSMSCTVLTITNDSALENTEAMSAILTTDLTVVLIPSTNISATILILEDPYDYITVGFANGTPSIATEGLNLTLKLCPEILNGSLEKDVFVIATTMDITAKSPSDYSYMSVELKFTHSQNTVCFSIGINNDANVLEYTEKFEVSLTEYDRAIHLPSQQRSIIVTILEDPDDEITVGFRSSSYICDETGGPISVCIQMYNGNLDRNVSMKITSIDGTSKAYLDYTPLNSTITFTYGMTSGSSICTYATIIDDDVVEEDVENFNLTLTETEPSVTTISLSISNIIIQERNNDAVDIGLNQRRYIGTEGHNVTVCAKVDKGVIERTVSVYLSAFSGTANEGADFVGVSRVVLKMPMYSSVNDTICTDIMITNDTDIEPEEQFTITLETVDPAVNITLKTGIVLILIDSHDVAVFEMKLNAVTVTEGRNSSFPICASLNSLSGTLTTSISVGLVTKDVSSSVYVGQDYNIEPHALVFSVWSVPGVTLMCSTVSIIDDNILENTEVFEVFLVSNDTSVVLDAQRRLTIVQIVEDGNDSITVGFNAAHSTVNENQGYIEICIDIIIGALERNISVYLQTIPISATSSKDYINVEKNITFSTGLSAFLDDKICTNIIIINDTVLENVEEFEVLVSPTLENQDVVLIPVVLSVDVVTIIEDPRDGIEVGFEQNSYNVSASDGMVLVCAAIYKGTLERGVAVLLVTSSDNSSSDAAIPGLDYTIVRVVVDFIPGQSEFVNRTQCISIGIVNDLTNVTVEQFRVVLDKVSADSTVVDFTKGLNNAAVYIYNDNKDYVFQFVNTQYVQLEGSPVLICIQMIKYPTGHVQTIPVILSTRSISATGGQDYDDSMHIILFHTELLNRTMTECTTIQTIDDHAIEGDETFEVNFVLLYPSYALVMNRSSAVVTILQSNKNYAVCRFIDITITGVAGEDIDVCLKLEDATGEIERPVNLSISTLNGTAIRGEDYVLQGPETTSFYPGSKIGTTKCLTVQLVNKTIANINSFSLLLTSDDPALKIMHVFNTLTVRIIQTSLQVPRVTMTAESVVTKEELGVAQLCAIITKGTMADDSAFHLLTLANTATDTLDYVSGDLTIRFMAGDTIGSTRCTRITIIDDDVLESSETFYAVLTSSDDAIATASPTVTSVLIQDDQSGKVIEIGFEMNNYTVWEAPNTTIAVCCKILHTNLTLGRPLEIGALVLSNLTTATGYSLPRSFKFSIGMTENSTQCINVTIQVQDSNVDEKLVLALVSLDQNASLAFAKGYDVTTVYIKEDFIEIHWITQNCAVKEGAYVELCAEISSHALWKDVVAMVNISLNTATFEDLYLPARTLIFKSDQISIRGNATSCFMVHIIDDMIVESEESFSVMLLSSGNVHVSPSNIATTVTILDDVSDEIRVGWSRSLYVVTEGEDTQILICADITNGTLQTTIVVPFINHTGSVHPATFGSDFTLSSWFLTFISGQSQYNESTSCVTMFIMNDTILEDTESFSLRFASANRTSYLPFRNVTNITIHEDPNDRAEFILMGNAFVVTEGLNNTISMCVLLTGGYLAKPVELILENQSGPLVTDYSIEGSIIFQPGSSAAQNTTQCFVLHVINDDIVENTEQFQLRLNLASTYCTVSGVLDINLAIVEDPADVVMLSFQSSTYYTREALSMASFEVCIEIKKGSLQRDISIIMVATNGTAIYNTDYALETTDVLFTSGQNQSYNNKHCNTITVLDDSILEYNESFTLSLVAAHPAITGAINTTTVIIIEDLSDLALFGFMKNTYDVTEGLNSTISLCTALKVGSLGKSVTLKLESKAGVSLANYNVERPITFQPGSSAADNSTECFIVDIINDDIVEDTQKIILRLTVMSSGCSIFGNSSSDGEVELTIFDDPTDVIKIAWSRSSYAVTEGENIQCIICADIVNGTLQTAMIVPFINLTGSATLGSDFILSSWFLTFLSGQSYNNQSRSCVSLLIINDTILESTEYFSLEFTPANRTVYLPFKTHTNITIYEDSNDRAEFILIGNAFVVTEGLNNTISVCVLLTIGHLAKPVELFLQSEKWVPVKDYSIEGSIIFQSGSSAAQNATQCFVVDIINDDIVEDTEQFQLILNVTSTYCTVSGMSQVNITIKEDPTDVVIFSFQSSDYYTHEASSSISLKVCIVIQKGSVERDISLTMVAKNITAIYDADYTLESTSVRFARGQNQSYNNMQCKYITVLDDSILEYNESFTLSIVAAHPAITGAINKTTVLIIEDPSDYVEIGFVQIQYEVDRVHLSMPLQTDIKMSVGSLQRNVSLTVDLASPMSTETPGTNVVFTMTATFTSGETSGAVHHEMLNISSLRTARGGNYASVTLKPIFEDRGVIHIVNNQASIKVTINSASSSTLPGIIGGVLALLALICFALMVVAAMSVICKTRKTNKTMPFTKADHMMKSPLQQPQAMLWMNSLPEYN